MRRLKA